MNLQPPGTAEGTAAATSPKPGWRTSEFWLTLAVHALTFLIASEALPVGSIWEKVAAFALSALSQAAYTTARGKVKAAAELPPPAGSRMTLNVLLLALLLPLLGGCGAGGVNPFAAPNSDYVTADRATFEAVAPEYSAYVAADPSLDAEQIARRQRTVATWRLRIEQAEKRSPSAAPDPFESPAPGP